jgi:UDP-glucose:(galactosyl)LPS alpha-1,2-glucosyltransferase
MEPIKIAFSFDHNFYRQTGVAIASLLDSAKNKVEYNIYCLCADDVTQNDKEELTHIVIDKSKNSQVLFIMIGDAFDDSTEIRGITKATYYRLFLHKLLPDVDKIIYSDADVLFKNDLTEIWKMPLEQNLLGAIKCPLINHKQDFEEYMNRFPYFKKYLKEMRGRYFNAGFILMNLKEIRKMNFDNKWLEMSKQEFFFMDQDILNITCKNKVTFLPPRYNILVNLLNSNNYTDLASENIFNQEDINDVYKKPAMLHFAGGKPWDNKNNAHADEWWTYVKENTHFYDFFLNSNAKKTPLVKKCLKVFKKFINYK